MNPFISVFTDTADFTDVDNELSTSVEMITVSKEDWEWQQKLIKYQNKMYRELVEEYDRLLARLERAIEL